jgi:uncharacterized protein
MPTPTPALATVQEVYGAFGRRDLAGLASHLDDNVAWTDPGTTGIYAGKRMGKAAVLDFFRQLNEQLDISGFELRDVYTLGGKVAVTGHIEGKAKATGAPFNTDWAMTWEVNEEGKVTGHQLYLDSENVATALRGTHAASAGVQSAMGFYAAMDASDYEGLKARVSPDFVIYHPNFPKPLNFEEFYSQQVKPFNKAFTNPVHAIAESSLAGDKLTVRGVVTAKHTGEIMGIPASNNEVAVPYLTYATLDANGRIRELHVQFNQIAFLSQIGVNPVSSR